MTSHRTTGDAGQLRGVVVVGPDCAATRQALDPTAWLVLEELVLNGGAVTGGTTVVVATSVRELAGRLGLSKDTVAAALRRLAGWGVVGREDERDRGSGRFGHSRYVIDLTTTGMRLAEPGAVGPPRASDTAMTAPDHQPTSDGADSATRTRRPPRARVASAGSQLSLLDPDQHPT